MATTRPFVTRKTLTRKRNDLFVTIKNKVISLLKEGFRFLKKLHYFIHRKTNQKLLKADSGQNMFPHEKVIRFTSL